MFTNTTWKQYIECILCISVAYYIFTGWLYRKNVIKWLNKKASALNSPAGLLLKIKKGNATPGGSMDPLSFESCINELDNYFQMAKANNPVKEELLFSLHKILQKYVSLKETSGEENIKKIIAFQCKEIFFYPLDSGEIDQLWFGL